jgi:cytochrome c oxidase cbb3-type subunit 3
MGVEPEAVFKPPCEKGKGRVGKGKQRVVHLGFHLMLAGLLAIAAPGQEPVTGDQAAPQRQPSQTMPADRAQATRTFLGLGAEPDKDAAARGEPLFQQNCAFCHGPKARGATGPGLITADEVLSDDHGEHLVAFLKKGRPQKGMPGFPTMTDAQLKDIAEFMHLQVELVANRGGYHVLNILVGNAARGKAYVGAHCSSCHSAETFAHLGSKFRSPEQLQKGWIWPSRSANPALAITAIVAMPDGATVAGRITQVSDFRITLADSAGQSHAIDLDKGVRVEMKDPLAAHQELIMMLTNSDMHDVTAYLETLK